MNQTNVDKPTLGKWIKVGKEFKWISLTQAEDEMLTIRHAEELVKNFKICGELFKVMGCDTHDIKVIAMMGALAITDKAFSYKSNYLDEKASVLKMNPEMFMEVD